ncbi:MAG: BON domain-containing protein [Armatimonadota bacterium]
MKLKKNIFLLMTVFLILSVIILPGCSKKKEEAVKNSKKKPAMQRGQGFSELNTTKELSVKSSLLSDPELASSNIIVQVNLNTATLSGSVASEDAKQRAENLAKQASGIDKVVNNLQVK